MSAAPPAAAPPAAAPQQQVRPAAGAAQAAAGHGSAVPAPRAAADRHRRPAARRRRGRRPPRRRIPGPSYAPVAAPPYSTAPLQRICAQLRHGERADPPVLPPLRNVARHAQRDGARPAGPAGQAAAAPLLGRRPATPAT